jgi:hypothetical protein
MLGRVHVFTIAKDEKSQLSENLNKKNSHVSKVKSKNVQTNPTTKKVRRIKTRLELIHSFNASSKFGAKNFVVSH